MTPKKIYIPKLSKEYQDMILDGTEVDDVQYLGKWLIPIDDGSEWWKVKFHGTFRESYGVRFNGHIWISYDNPTIIMERLRFAETIDELKYLNRMYHFASYCDDNPGRILYQRKFDKFRKELR